MASGKRVGLCSIPVQQSKSSEKLSFSIHRQLQVMTLELGSTIVCTNVKTNVQSICVCVHCGTVTNILWRCSTVEAGRFGFRAGINKAHSYFTFHTLCIPVFTVDGAITRDCVASLAFFCQFLLRCSATSSWCISLSIE